MKIMLILIAGFLFISCAKGNDSMYTGSTPGGPAVKAFLDIPLTDSVDFIRWKLFILEDSYRLQCHYGISKPNTNGFMHGGKKIEFTGVLKKEKIYFELRNGNRSLKLARINEGLLHLLNADNEFLVGNGGWSYTLNHTAATPTDEINFSAQTPALKDSMTFVGRTPCNIPGIVEKAANCYKLKWSVVLYANEKLHVPGTYRIRGTAWENGRTGNWMITKGK
jgi:hypothetical protein